MRVVKEWERAMIRLTRCSEGFQRSTKDGSCKQKKDVEGREAADFVDEDAVGAGMCTMGANYLNAPIAIKVSEMRAFVDLLCGDQHNQLYSVALALGLGKPPEAVCLAAAYDTFLLHNLLEGFDGSHTQTRSFFISGHTSSQISLLATWSSVSDANLQSLGTINAT